jgi:hypothetical protein
MRHDAAVRRAARRVLAAATLLAGLAVTTNADQQPLTLLGTFDVDDSPFGASDYSVAAGPDRLLITSNGGLSIRQKSGALMASISLSDFFRSVEGPTGSAFDVRSLYDATSGRFFVIAAGSNGQATSSFFFLAVSRASAPASLVGTDWHFYALDATLDNATPTGRWADFPSLGVSDDAVVITAQMFPFNSTTAADKTLKIRVLDKTPLLAGTVPRWVDFTNITDPANGRPLGAALQPVHHFTGANSAFVLGSAESGCGQIVFGIRNAATAPVLSSRFVPFTSPCGPQMPAAPQRGGPPAMSFGGLRMPAVYRNGSIWVAQGVGKTAASGTVSAIRLSQIDVRAWPQTATIVQDTVVGENEVGVHYPALTVDPSNHVALAFGRSSSTEFLSLYATGRLGTDPPNTLRTPLLFKAGDGSLCCVLPGRDGITFADYFGASLDPTDGTVWIVGEYGRASGTLGRGRWVGHVAFPAASATPPSLTLTLNASGFGLRDSMILTASMTPGTTPTAVDAYVVVRTPDGSLYSLRPDGGVVAGVVPLATRLAPFRFTGDLARIAFNSAIPAGRYTWQAYLTEPGATAVVGVVNETSFTLTP